MKPALYILFFAAVVAVAAAAQHASSQPGQTQPATSQPATRPAETGTEGLDLATDLLEMKVPTVVTASRRGQPITNVPYAISAITQQDIRSAGARSVPDALRLIPGMDVADLTADNWAASARGVHGLLSNQMLVLVDGRQIFDSVFGGTLWGSWPFQIEDIDRIEVLRGPAGVTWGANAMNGVINIITKDPADQKGLTFRGGAGSRGTQREYLGTGVVDGKLRLRISGEYDASDGFARGGSWLRSLDDGFNLGHMTLHGIYDAGPRDTFTFSAGSAVQDGGCQPPPVGGFFRLAHQEGQAEYALGKWTHQIEKNNTVQVTAYFNDFHARPGTKSIDYRYQQYALQIAHTFKPAAAHTVTWGIDTRGDAVDATAGDPPMLRRPYVPSAMFGAYVQDEWQFAPRWTLSLGGRVDYETDGHFEPSARMSLAHQVADNTALYGAVSRAYHSIPEAARFLNIRLLDGLAGFSAAPGLTSETSMSYELGARGRYFGGLDLTGNFFWQDFEDVYSFLPRLGPPGLFHLHDENGARAGIYGTELDAKYPLTKSVTLLGNYTYEQLAWNGGAGIWQKDAMSPPHHKFMLGARYDPIADLHLSSFLYFVDSVEAPNPPFPLVSRDIDRYFRLDLRAEYEFWDKRASLAVGVRNLLDDHHPEGTTLFLNNAEVPRMIYAELRIRIP
jgi:iron complex outermembrane recepter protein